MLNFINIKIFIVDVFFFINYEGIVLSIIVFRYVEDIVKWLF